MKSIICIFALLILISPNACEQSGSIVEGEKAVGESRPKEIQPNTIMDGIKEGNIYSIQRWRRIQGNLKDIRIGMKRHEVIKIIGNPDGIAFSPENVMQYSVAHGVVDGDCLTTPIHIILDENQSVIEVKRVASILGPPVQ